MNGVENRAFKAWSNTLNEYAFSAGNFPVGFVNGDPIMTKTSASAFDI